jgi:hypothetical protein
LYNAPAFVPSGPYKRSCKSLKIEENLKSADKKDNLMRYKFYREHKYVSHCLNTLERLIAKTDFTILEELKHVQNEFDKLKQMLEGHAQYENDCLHPLLTEKQSSVPAHILTEHQNLDKEFEAIQAKINIISTSVTQEEKIEAGYQLYIRFRQFVGENLIHLHEEETLILPELQRLYTDDELRAVEFRNYNQMSAEDLISMMEELFPQMNPSDRIVFLDDIKVCDPVKFEVLWEGIQSKIAAKERADIIRKLNIQYS